MKINSGNFLSLLIAILIIFVPSKTIFAAELYDVNLEENQIILSGIGTESSVSEPVETQPYKIKKAESESFENEPRTSGMSDLEPPELIDIEVSNSEAEAPGTIEVEVTATDDSSGLKRGVLTFLNKAANKYIHINLDADTIWNDATQSYETIPQGKLKGVLILDQYQYPGDYELFDVSLRDKAENQQRYIKDATDWDLQNGSKQLAIHTKFNVIRGESEDKWPDRYNIPTDKIWKIKFNKSVSVDYIKEQNIYVTDQNGEIIPMLYYKDDQGIEKYIHVKPIKDYKNGQTYTLWIKKLKAEDGSILEKDVQMKFNIQ